MKRFHRIDRTVIEKKTKKENETPSNANANVVTIKITTAQYKETTSDDGIVITFRETFITTEEESHLENCFSTSGENEI